MTEKQCRLAELQAQYASLTKKRDRLDFADDADVSAYTLHRLLTGITKVEAEIAELQQQLGGVGANCFGMTVDGATSQPMSNWIPCASGSSSE